MLNYCFPLFKPIVLFQVPENGWSKSSSLKLDVETQVYNPNKDKIEKAIFEYTLSLRPAQATQETLS